VLQEARDTKAGAHVHGGSVPTPDISLIVCTRNRAASLRAMLASLANQEFAGTCEIVLVNNGSSDETPAVVQAFALESPWPVLHLFEPVPGLARARNRGLASARGEIVACTDDDCYPSPDYLAALVECFCERGVDFAGGRVLLFDPTDKPLTIQNARERLEISPYSYIHAGMIHGANMAFRREALLEIGGFDERLGAGTRFKSGEDVDVLRRLSWCGKRGVYDPRICVYHHHGRKTDDDVRRASKGHDSGIGACFAKFACRREPRGVYLRQWYWQMRGNSMRRNVRQVSAALCFVARAGFVPKNVWTHPRHGLRLPPDECG
jgi:glycosyltransferase involved in cell wall biosynthesis